MFRRAADRIYERVVKRLIKPTVKKDMERLHPGEDADRLCREYYLDKLKKSLLIFLAGCMLAGGFSIQTFQRRTIEENRLIRENVGGETQNVTIETVIDGQKEKFEFLVQPQQMDKETAEVLLEKFQKRLPLLIAGENFSLEAVSKNLVLMESYENFPFFVEWRSDTPDCISSAGVVVPKENESQVTLRALISYGIWEWEERLTVQVISEELSDRQVRHNAVEEALLDAQEKSLSETFCPLPANWEGEEIVWHRSVENYSFWLWIAVPVLAIVVYIVKDQDLHRELEKRQEEIKRCYPDIVHGCIDAVEAVVCVKSAYGYDCEITRLKSYSEP